MEKARNKIHGMTKRAEKAVKRHDLLFKSIFMIFSLLPVALAPALMEGDISAKIPYPYHDFGVYEEKDAFLSNLSAIEESSDIANIADQALNVTIHDDTDQIQLWDGAKDIMSFETLTVPRTDRSAILEEAQDFGVESILSTILDGRSYYIYANCSGNPDGVWVTSWNVADPLKRPVIHSKLVTDVVEVSLLDPTPVDIDEDGVDDIEVELLIEADIDGSVTDILDASLGYVPVPSLPISPLLGDNPPNIRITNPPTDLWVVGRTFETDTWQIAGWVWEFDTEFIEPEVERVVVSIDSNGDDAVWNEAQLTHMINVSWPERSWYKWYYNWSLRDVENGMHTIYARAYEGDQFSEDSVNVIVSNPVYKRVRLLVNVDRINNAYNQTSEVNILRPISHGDAEYIWALGMCFENITQHFTAYLSPETLSLSQHLPAPGSILLGSLLVENIEGPYYLGWNASSTPQGLELRFSHAVVEPSADKNLTEITLLELSFLGSDPPRNAEVKMALNTSLFLGSDISADANLLEWHADSVANLSLVYHDEREKDTIHLIASIFDMPVDLVIELENQSSVKPYDVYTSMHLNSSSGIAALTLNEYLFEDGNLTIALGVNISSLPKEFYLNGTYSALSVQSPQILSLGGNYTWPFVWDIITIYIGRIFLQVADRMVSLPYRIFDQGLLQGEYVLNALGSEEIGEMEFHITNQTYPQLEENFLCIHNASESELAISGRLQGVIGFQARSNETGVYVEANVTTNEGFRLLNLHGPNAQDFELLNLSNMPRHLIISMNTTCINYTANDNVNGLELLSNNSGHHIYLNITDIPRQLNFVQGESSIMLDAFDEGIAKIEFAVTDSKVESLDGDYLLLKSVQDMNMLSGRISDLKRLYYSDTDTSTLSLSLKGGAPFRIVGRIDSQDIEERLVLDAFIDKIPDELEISVPNDRLNFSLDIMDFTSVSGVQDITRAFSSLARMGDSVLDLMVNITELLTTELSELVGGVSISYSLAEESNIDLIASVELGDVSQIMDCNWTHGVSARTGGDDSLCARVFLTGLPQSAGVMLKLVGDKRFVDFTLNNFRPEYNWLLFDVHVINGIDVFFYVDDIKGKIDLIALNSSFEITPANTIADLNASIRSRTGLGRVYLLGGILDPYPTEVEMFLSGIPESLDARISAQNDIDIEYNASQSIEHLMLSISRFIDEKWYYGNVIAHDIPQYMDISFKANTEYTKDTPLLGMPSIDVSAGEDTLDLYLNMDGRVFGRRGHYEVYAENIRSGLTAGLEGDTYKVRAESLDNFVMEARDLPLMPMYELRALNLYVKGLKKVDLKVSMAAGLYPIIQLGDPEVEDLKIALSHDMQVLGAKVSPKVVLSEATCIQLDNPKLLIPFRNPTHINGISTTFGGGRTVLIVPNIFATLAVTFPSVFILLVVLLLMLWLGVKIYGTLSMKDDPEPEEPQDEHTGGESNEDRVEKERTRNRADRRRRKKMVTVAFLLILLAGLVYYFFVPWVELKVKTDFIETPSGIFVICEASNTGTVLIEDLRVSFAVYNLTGELMNSTTFSENILRRWHNANGYVHYFGDQFEPYRIRISVDFTANGRGYEKMFHHDAKDYMRLEFENTVP